MDAQGQATDSHIWVPLEVLADSSVFRQAIRWYCASASALGGLVGISAGLSSSPVVGTILPLLFTLIVSSSGVYLARADFSIPLTTIRIRGIGITIILFSSFVLLGGTIGILIRVKAHSPDEVSVETALKDASSEEYLELLLLKTRLAAIDASPSEQRTALYKAGADLKHRKATVPDADIQWYLDRTRFTVSQVDALMKRADANSEKIPESLPDHLQRLHDFEDALSTWHKKPSLGGMPRKVFSHHYTNVFYSVVQLTRFGHDENLWLRSKMDLAKLNELYERLDLEINESVTPKWSSGESLGKELDALITILKKVRKDEREEVLPYMEFGSANDSKEDSDANTDSQ